MQTGPIGSWLVNPLDLGPLYPFVGFEVALVTICAVFWAVYVVWQIRFEHERCGREAKRLSGLGVLPKAIDNPVSSIRGDPASPRSDFLEK